METPIADPPQDDPAPPKKDAQRTTAELFKFSAWVHVGAAPADCDHAENGRCDDPRHFHAWCRLPNQFQHQDIRERALAAKARRMRQLRDPQTDAYEVLESELSDLLRDGDRDQMVDELLGKDWWKRHLEALGEVNEREEFKTIDLDRERLAELRELEGEKPKDEYEELERHLSEHSDAVEAERDRIELPLKEALEGLDTAELVDHIRTDRIAAEASSAFMDTYSKWEWLAGAFTTDDPLTRKPAFASLDELVSAAPEIIDALRAAYAEMETALQRGARGN